MPIKAENKEDCDEPYFSNSAEWERENVCSWKWSSYLYVHDEMV
jgi:hypothetical protein